MITKWKIFNFKSIQNETELDFAPLTIFAGSNSSGKSTILQSILLISQTLSSTIGSRSIVLNGILTRLGQFNDLRSFDGGSEQIVIGWEYTPPSDTMLDVLETSSFRRRASISGFRGYPLKKITCEVAFDADSSSPEREYYQLQPRLFSFQFKVLTRDRDNVDVVNTITLTRNPPKLEDNSGRIKGIVIEEEQKDSLNYEVQMDNELLERLKEYLSTALPVGCSLRHFLPERMLIRIDKTIEEAKIIASAICDDDTYGTRNLPLHRKDINISMGIIEKLKDIIGQDLLEQIFESNEESEVLYTVQRWDEGIHKLPVRTRRETKTRLQNHSDLSETVFRLAQTEKEEELILLEIGTPRILTTSINHIQNFYSNSVKYLGPLRDEPKALYPLTTSGSPSDVGLRGEYTAAVLDLHKNKHIQYIPTTQFQESMIQAIEKTRTLESAIIDWLNYLGVSENIESRDMGKLGHELKVTLSKNGKAHDLTHAGVGVSQVLPILLMCLLAKPGTTIILEQPELHLHPKVQTLLGDFFLSMSLLGKQCIIETHSEYLINRLRYRLASAPLEKELTSKIKMYFVEKKENASAFREVVVNEYGAITDWPEGFFDQSQLEAEEILRAASNKRKQIKKIQQERYLNA